MEHASMHRHLTMVASVVDEIITTHATDRDVSRLRRAKSELERIVRSLGPDDIQGMASRALRILDKADRFLEENRPTKHSEPRPRHLHPPTIEAVVCSHRQFCLSDAAQGRFLHLTGRRVSADGYLSNGERVKRTDPDLIRIVRESDSGGTEPGGWCRSSLHIALLPWNAYYVAYPFGEVVYETLNDAARDTWDWELDMVHVRTGFTVPHEAVKAVRRLMGL
jgi:hypothetical protein